MKYLLEYSERRHMFHYNYIESSGRFHNQLFTNDFKPVAVINDRIEEDKELSKLMDAIVKSELCYEDACAVLLRYMLEDKVPTPKK